MKFLAGEAVIPGAMPRCQHCRRTEDMHLLSGECNGGGPIFTISIGTGPLNEREYVIEHPTTWQLVRGPRRATRYRTYDDARHAANELERHTGKHGTVVQHD